MKNTKEVQTILTAIFALNQCSENKDCNISQIIDYAFRRLYGANTNLLILATIGKKYPDMIDEIEELLHQDTKFEEYGYEILP